MGFPRMPISELVLTGEAALKTGPFGTQLKASEYTDRGTPVINVRNIGMGGIQADKLEYIPDSTRDRLSSHLLRCGDIVFGRKGAVERHAFIRQEQEGWFQGSDCLRLRFNSPRVDPQFCSYFFLTAEHQRWMMNQCSHGATMASLNQDILERIELPLPPLPIQRRIAGILSAYDDLIENNLRRIRILEEMARSIYREWFFHFRFPGHEKDSLVDSILGPIPEGWEVKSLANLMEIRGGSQPPKSDFVDEEQSGYVRLIQIRDYESDSHLTFIPESSKLRLCERQDVMIARYGASVARICSGLKGAYNVALVKVCPLAPGSREFLRQFLSADEFQKLLIGMSGRAAQNGFNKRDIAAVKLAFPSDPRLLYRFDHFAAPTRDAVLACQDQIQNLRRTRDLLLPRLLSGTINIPGNNFFDSRVSDEKSSVEPTKAIKIDSDHSTASPGDFLDFDNRAPTAALKVKLSSQGAAQKRSGNQLQPVYELPFPIDHTDRSDVLAVIRQVFGDGQPRTREIAISDVARALGYGRVGNRIQDVLHKDLLTAVRRGILENAGGELRLFVRSIADYDRDFLKRQFLAAIGRSWIERNDAIQNFCRWLGFRRTGRVVDEEARSLIQGLLRETRLEADGPNLIRRATG